MIDKVFSVSDTVLRSSKGASGRFYFSFHPISRLLSLSEERLPATNLTLFGTLSTDFVLKSCTEFCYHWTSKFGNLAERQMELAMTTQGDLRVYLPFFIAFFSSCLKPLDEEVWENARDNGKTKEKKKRKTTRTLDQWLSYYLPK